MCFCNVHWQRGTRNMILVILLLCHLKKIYKFLNRLNIKIKLKDTFPQVPFLKWVWIMHHFPQSHEDLLSTGNYYVNKQAVSELHMKRDLQGKHFHDTIIAIKKSVLGRPCCCTGQIKMHWKNSLAYLFRPEDVFFLQFTFYACLNYKYETVQQLSQTAWNVMRPRLWPHSNLDHHHFRGLRVWNSFFFSHVRFPRTDR